MITDWDDAYQNMAYIPGGADYPPKWAAAAAAFRAGAGGEEIAYGPGARQRLDLFHPAGTPRGLVVVIHGGYWRAFGKSDWSHLAAGSLALGWAVAVPGYTICPEGTVPGITREIAWAVETAAARVGGQIRLTGHSAGGHLATRMVCTDVPLAVAGRVERVVSISGVHDLRPLLATQLNEILGLDPVTATAESPALRIPRPGTRLTAWVGADERPEFVRQNALLANVWTGLGADTACVEDTGRHHFDVVEALADPDAPLTRAVAA